MSHELIEMCTKLSEQRGNEKRAYGGGGCQVMFWQAASLSA